MLKNEAADAPLPPPELPPIESALDPDAPFWSLCQQIGGMDAFLDRAETEGFDPAAAIGSLLNASAEKVEKLVSMIEEFEAKAALVGARAKKLAKRAATAQATADSIHRYAEESMRAQKLQEMPGIERKFFFQATDAKVEVSRDPTPQDFLRFGGDLVKMVPESFAWRLPELKRVLKAGEQEIDFAELKPNDSLRIGERINVSIKRKPKKETQG